MNEVKKGRRTVDLAKSDGGNKASVPLTRPFSLVIFLMWCDEEEGTSEKTSNFEFHH